MSALKRKEGLLQQMDGKRDSPCLREVVYSAPPELSLVVPVVVNGLSTADKKSLETTNLESQRSQSPKSVDPSRDGSTLANEDIEDSSWIQCDYCQKWRLVSKDVADQFPDNISWNCKINPDTAFDRCTIPEEDTSDWVDVLEDKDLTYKTSKKTEESGIDPGPSVVSGVQTRVGRKVKPPSRFTD